MRRFDTAIALADHRLAELCANIDMNHTELLPGIPPTSVTGIPITAVKTAKPPRIVKSCEFKISVLRECTAENAFVGGDVRDKADKAVAYWRTAVVSSPNYNPDVESLVILALSTRDRIIGHVVIATGSLDTIYVSAREIFKPAIALNAATFIMMHNHPSGDSTPSTADITCTREMIRCAKILKIPLVDHIVVGHPSFGRGYTSINDTGHFYE